MNEAAGRAIVSERADGRCEVRMPGICLGGHQSTHHRLKRGRCSADQLWAPSNLLATCGDGTAGCHGWIEAHPQIAHRMGWWVMAGDGEPDHIPVFLRPVYGPWWYTLDDEGLLNMVSVTTDDH